jgi:hypothetical protein
MDKEKPEGWALERISRRKALKRVAAGAAVAWSAPVLTSLSSPAYAQYGACATCPPFSCLDPIVCSTVCFCAPHEPTGACVCWAPVGICSGDAANPDICDTDAECEPITGPGSKCLTLAPGTCAAGGCAAEADSFCAQPCSTDASAGEGPPIRAL